MTLKSRLALLAALLTLMALAAAPMASATADTPHPAQLSAHSLSPHSPDFTDLAFCLNTQDDLCLNAKNCNTNTTPEVQLWNVTTGGRCSDDWTAYFAGYVGTSAGNVFFCGDDLNAKYYGDPVYDVSFPSADDSYPFLYPHSDGDGNPVYANSDSPPGNLVATGNSADTELIDPNTTCDDDGQVQYVYAGCEGNGCLVRESPNPPSLLFWYFP